MNLPPEQRREWIRSRRAQRKLTRRARLRRQLLRYVLLSLLLVLGASGLCCLPWSLANSHQSIIVKGNKVVTSEQIRSALANTLTKPLYRLDPSQLEGDVQRLSAIKHAFVRRYCLPTPRLVVLVLEEFPWASYATESNQKANWVIAESGRLISIAQFPEIFQPALMLYGPDSLHLTSKEVGQWANWITYIEKQTQHKVEIIDLRNRQDVRVKAGDLCLKLGSPDNSLTRRLARLASILSTIQPLEDKLEYVDLGLDSNIPLKLAKKADGTRGTL